MEIEKIIACSIPTFWYMTESHQFIRVEGDQLSEVSRKLLQLAKQNPLGMICPVVVMRGKKEERRIGSPVHVDHKGHVDLEAWIKEVMQDDLVRVNFYKIH